MNLVGSSLQHGTEPDTTEIRAAGSRSLQESEPAEEINAGSCWRQAQHGTAAETTEISAAGSRSLQESEPAEEINAGSCWRQESELPQPRHQ